MAHEHHSHSHSHDHGDDHGNLATNEPRSYFTSASTVTIPPLTKKVASRLAFPVLSLLSREQSLKLHLTPIDDERVIMALRNVQGRVLDIGCGSNTFVRSYGNGTGVDVVEWKGCDLRIDDAGVLPFDDQSYDTVSYLACINHIPNREQSLTEAYRVLKPGGRLMITMIPPRLGAFIHWLRERNDPDHRERHIDHSHELMGMSSRQIREIVTGAGFRDVRRKPFVFGFNSMYLATK